mgnify:CR=1 FL=1
METLPTCSELGMLEFRRMAGERLAIRPPEWGEDFLEYMRASSAYVRLIDQWAKENPDEARRLMAEAEARAVREHEARISERLKEHAAAKAASAAPDLKRFLSEIGVGDVTRDAVVGSLEETIALRAVKEWTKTGGILLLLGSKGTGKTTAAAWGLSMLGVTKWPRCFCDRCRGGGPMEDCFVGAGHRAQVADEDLNPTKARFVKAGHLAAALHRPGGEATWDEVRKVYALAIDDLGREYSDQHGRWLAELDLLIDDRHEMRRPTVITSNLGPEEFKQRYGERIADRIRQMGLVVNCVGESLRRAG